MQTILAPGTGRNGTERFGDWLVGEAGETQGCRYFFKNSVCGKVVSMRIGMGYDVHRLVEGRPLILGGVTIPYERGLLGHSDADVLIHAVIDALLGAAAMGDIGRLFPDSSPEYKDIDSLILLKRAWQMVRGAGYEVCSVDATVIAQEPKLAPYIDNMRSNIADAMGCDVGIVSAKATTPEHTGPEGNLECITARSVCMIRG